MNESNELFDHFKDKHGMIWRTIPLRNKRIGTETHNILRESPGLENTTKELLTVLDI